MSHSLKYLGVEFDAALKTLKSDAKDSKRALDCELDDIRPNWFTTLSVDRAVRRDKASSNAVTDSLDFKR